MLTSNIDIYCGEGCQWYSCNILGSNTKHKILGGLIIQGLCHQDGGRTILSVGGQVEANWHVGLWDHTILQVVSHPGIPQRRGGFDGLWNRHKNREQQ